MSFLNTLSIRERFLISPLIGIVLTLILYFAANATIQSKVDLLTELNQSNLPLISEFSKSSIAMLKIHSELTYLLLVSLQDPDEETLYLGGRKIIDQLYEVEKNLYLHLGKSEQVVINQLDINLQIKEAFSHYKQVVISSIELVSVDPREARAELIRANALLIQSYELLIVISNYYIDSVSKRTLLIEESLAGGSIVGLLTIMLMLVMIITSLYFARRMSSSIEIINNVMVRLANGEIAIDLPANSDKYLANSYAAVATFKDTLQKNQRQQYELRNAVAELSNSKQKYFDLLDISASAIIVIDENMSITLFNKAAQNIFGYQFYEVVNISLFKLLDTSNASQYLAFKNFVDDDSQKLIAFDTEAVTGIRKGGEEFFLHAFIAKHQSSGKMLITISITDITERLLAKEKLLRNQDQLEELVKERTSELQQSLDELRRTQRRLIESEKMAALGGLVAGVAHEINTPVGIAITSSSQLQDLTEVIEQKYHNGSLSKKDLQKFILQIQSSNNINMLNLTRAAELINSFKEISVDQCTAEVREFDIKNYTEDILTSLRTKFQNTQHTISLECPDALVIYNIPGVYSQILTNFIMNSLVHGFEHIEQGVIQINIQQCDGHICLNYTDNGCGMSQQQLDQIYDPFFTSKRSSGSTGLGMHIVYNLVSQKLRGSIKCNSEVDGGVEFNIEFPINVEEPPLQQQL
ncbi:MAG: PAS domain-containing sensor histidine kinase [Pseudomonadales bacterium]|nr:PAS domain-containing sensor histidine kinase [Pseudomonadales bacterium]